MIYVGCERGEDKGRVRQSKDEGHANPLRTNLLKISDNLVRILLDVFRQCIRLELVHSFF